MRIQTFCLIENFVFDGFISIASITNGPYLWKQGQSKVRLQFLHQ